MLTGKASLNRIVWRRAARGIGEFILFLILFMAIASVIAGVLTALFVGSSISLYVSDSGELSTFAHLFVKASAGYFGVMWGVSAFSAIMKRRPARWIGVAFLIFFLANYGLYSIFFPEHVDDVVLYGIVSSAVAIVTAWFVFQLPPSTTVGQSVAAIVNRTVPRPLALTIDLLASPLGNFLFSLLGAAYFGYKHDLWSYWAVPIWAFLWAITIMWDSRASLRHAVGVWRNASAMSATI
jgi:hypothetical protein